MAQAFGRATIPVNGQTLNSNDGASFDPGGITRTTQTTDQQSDYVESIRPAMVKCRVPLNPGMSMVDFNNLVGVTVQFITDTGQAYILPDAWRTGPLEVTGGQNGGIDLVFEADPNLVAEVGV